MTKGPLFPFEYAPGATPLDPNEINGLLLNYISTQAELNELEQKNILKAKLWFSNKKHKTILTDSFIRDLHKNMFNDVWSWAGTYRLSDKSIGPSWHNVPTEILNLLRDVEYWIPNATFDWNEIGARFHHRLVLIHAFPNGNGRHARLMTDILLQNYQQPPFSWGARSASVKTELESSNDVRKEYIEALKAADAKKYDLLIRFIRS